jgi:hypothetical protein
MRRPLDSALCLTSKLKSNHALPESLANLAKERPLFALSFYAISYASLIKSSLYHRTEVFRPQAALIILNPISDRPTDARSIQ